MARCCAQFVGGLVCRLPGCVVRSDIQVAAICFVMRRLVRRENASPDLDLSAYVQHAQAEVDVCVAPEPHRLGHRSPNVSGMVTACTAVGTVAVQCSRAGSTVVSGSFFFLSLFRLSGAATHHHMRHVLSVTVCGVRCYVTVEFGEMQYAL